VRNVDAAGNPKPGRTPKTCSDRCRKRMQLRLPNVPRRRTNHTDLAALPFDPSWIPKHPVDEPEVFGVCAANDCHEPLTRRGQAFCSSRCRTTAHRAGFTKGSIERTAERLERERITKIRADTLENDRIDRCRRCDDYGRRRNGTVCGH
jgi:hypothetical protein